MFLRECCAEAIGGRKNLAPVEQSSAQGVGRGGGVTRIPLDRPVNVDLYTVAWWAHVERYTRMPAVLT